MFAVGFALGTVHSQDDFSLPGDVAAPPEVAAAPAGGTGVFTILVVVVTTIVITVLILIPLLKKRANDKDDDKSHPQAPTPEPPKVQVHRKKVFVSYRRSDSADVTGRLYDRLVSTFGREQIFKDVDSIPLGEDFREHIDQAVEESSVFLTIIGPNWLGQDSADTKIRSIDSPRDFVRLENESALVQGIPVIPILVHNAQLPEEDDLPETVKALAFRNGTTLRPDPDFQHDISRIISAVERHLGNA